MNWRELGKTASEILDTTNEVVGVANNVRSNYRDGKALVDKYNSNKMEKDTEEGRMLMAEINRIDRINTFVMYFNLILLAGMIIATIVLCVMNNDIILQLLHL